MISIISASNDKNILNKCLIKSLERQTYKEYELIVIDTTRKKYNGCIEAFEEGIKKSKGDILIFVHHDVIFEKEDELEKIVENIRKIDFGIAGVAGASIKRNFLIGNITNGPKKEKVSNIEIDKPVKVQTVDEVLFVIKKEVLQEHPFNRENNTWHLYAVEYSLEMLKMGKEVYVIPSNIYHVSPGYSLNRSYFDYLPKVIKKYKKMNRWINTTVGSWYTNPLLFKLQMLRRR